MNRLVVSAKDAPRKAIAAALESQEIVAELAALADYSGSRFEAGLMRLAETKATTRDIGSLRRAITERRRVDRGMRVVEHGDVTPPTSLLELVPEAPVAHAAVVPAGWMLSDDGIFKQTTEGRRRIAPAPVVISGRVLDVSTSEEQFVLAYPRDGRWREHVEPRETVASTRSITTLAKWGMPVNSENARALVSFLAEYEAANEGVLPVDRVTSRLGWQPDGSFLWGKSVVIDGSAHIRE